MKRSRLIGWIAFFPWAVVLYGLIWTSMAWGAIVSVGDKPLGVAVHPDGSFVFVSNAGDDTVVEIRVSDLTVTRTFQVGSYPAGLIVSPDGAFIYVVSNQSDQLHIIQYSDGSITDVDTGSGPWGVAMDASGEHLYVTNSGEDTVSIFDTATNTITGTVEVGAEPIGLAISSDSSTLYVSNQGSNTVSVVDLSTETVTDTIDVGAEPIGLHLDAGEDYLYVTNFGDDTVSVVRVSDNTVNRTIEVSDGPSEVAITPDGRYVYVTGSNAHEVSIISTTDYSVTTRPVENTPVEIQFLPDGSYFYVANFGSDSVSVLYKLLVRLMAISSPAVSSAGTIEVQWRPDDAGSYRVESGGSDAPGTGNLLREGAVAAEETVVTSINGASLGSAEGSYRVYFYVTDATGRTGSNYTSLRLDNTAPAAPTGFESRVGDRQLFLEWNAGEESDIGGYRVYFGTASGQYDLQGSPVTVSDPDATSYTLKNLENNAVYYLVLTALDEAGNESPPSEEIIAIPEEILGAAGLSGDSENGCFVATVCFGSQYDESVRSLRRLRDEFLRKDFLGRGLIRIYYVLGPRAAEFISDKPTLKWAVRGALLPLVYMEPFLSPQPGPASLLVLFILAGPSIILVLRFSRARRSRRME